MKIQLMASSFCTAVDYEPITATDAVTVFSPKSRMMEASNRSFDPMIR